VKASIEPDPWADAVFAPHPYSQQKARATRVWMGVGVAAVLCVALVSGLRPTAAAHQELERPTVTAAADLAVKAAQTTVGSAPAPAVKRERPQRKAADILEERR